MDIVTLIILIVVGLIAVGFVAYMITVYNTIIRMRNNVKKSWANIDALLKQRHDELPKLINSVKGYMKYEEKLLTKMTLARTKFLNAQNTQEKIEADNMISEALKSIFAVSENYPDLKASKNFIQLQSRISELENELSDRREFYNDSVNEFNIKINQFFDKNIAGLMGETEKKPMFKVSEENKLDVEIKF